MHSPTETRSKFNRTLGIFGVLLVTAIIVLATPSVRNHTPQLKQAATTPITCGKTPLQCDSNLPAQTGLFSSGAQTPLQIMQPFQTIQFGICIRGAFPTTHSQISGECILGQVSIFAFNFAPRNWAKCEGQLMAISSWSALFAVIGTRYGGDGRTTFQLPDLRGRVPVHPDDRTIRLGQRGGWESVQMTVNQLGAHTHGSSVESPFSCAAGCSVKTTIKTQNTGQSSPIDIRQPYLGVNFLIALQGTYPSRSRRRLLASGDPMMGGILMFAGNPQNLVGNNYQTCNGQLIPIQENVALFSLLGTSYGGDGITTFALPDLRAAVVIGAQSTNRPGVKQGSNFVQLTVDQIPSHTHSIGSFSVNCGSCKQNFATGNTAAVGGGRPVSSLQQSVQLNYIICMQGVYPSRSRRRLQPGLDDIMGFVGITAVTFAPRSYMVSSGQLLSINQNQALYSLLGTTYGGDGRTTFAVPNFQGRVPISQGGAPGLTSRRIGELGGASQLQITANTIAKHSHGETAVVSA